MVGVQGIEPWLQPPHGRVLPLYDTPIETANNFRKRYFTLRSLGEGGAKVGSLNLSQNFQKEKPGTQAPFCEKSLAQGLGWREES